MERPPPPYHDPSEASDLESVMHSPVQGRSKSRASSLASQTVLEIDDEPGSLPTTKDNVSSHTVPHASTGDYKIPIANQKCLPSQFRSWTRFFGKAN